MASDTDKRRRGKGDKPLTRSNTKGAGGGRARAGEKTTAEKKRKKRKNDKPLTRAQITALPPKLLIDEVSNLSRHAEKTLRNRAYAGKEPLPTKAGGRLLWDKAEVLAWVGEPEVQE